MAGIEVQANLLNALIGDHYIREAPLGARLAFALLPSLLLLAAFWRLKPSRALAVSIAAVALMALLPVLLLVWGGVWVPPAAGLVGLLLVYPLWGWRRLQAIDDAIGAELALFGGEAAPARHYLDPVADHAVQLGTSIAALRDLRRLIADTIEGVADPVIVTRLDGGVLLTNASAQPLLAGLDLGAIGDEVELADGRRFSPRRTALTGGDGQQRGWILLLAEITAIRRAERDREAALEFLSHDMRSPQASILALLDGDVSPGAARIAGHARRTLRLADDFVQLARLGGTVFAPEAVDLCDALAEASDAVWPLASAKRITVTRGGVDQSCWILGERHALLRAMLNLLDNAVKFSPEGAAVQCHVVDADGWVEVAIEDVGPGVACERLSNLFGAFGPIERTGHAAGLGLAYVQAVALRHGGSVAHRAMTPHGARFTLRLPSAEGGADQGR